VNFGYNEFWHNLFDMEFPKHKQWFESIHYQQPLENVNTTLRHVFNHLQNCPITINYVVDSNSIPSLVANKTIWFWAFDWIHDTLCLQIQGIEQFDFVSKWFWVSIEIYDTLFCTFITHNALILFQDDLGFYWDHDPLFCKTIIDMFWYLRSFCLIQTFRCSFWQFHRFIWLLLMTNL
jgi:hypothetical protein